MTYHRFCSRLACIALLLLMTGLVFPAAAQAGQLREEARLVDILWRWVADHLIPGSTPESQAGEEGWGMDPNGGK
jgi:hypothetical protein